MYGNTKYCNLCDANISGETLKDHGEKSHPDYWLNSNNEFRVKKYFNPINGRWFSNTNELGRNLIKENINKKMFWDKYGKEYLSDIWESNYDEKYGYAKCYSTCLECGKEQEKLSKQSFSYTPFCCFSCSTTWHAKNTDRVERAQATNNQRIKENPNHNLRPTQLQYWLNKGFSETEAKARVRERQATNSLEKLIEKHGEEEGTKKRMEITEKWFESLKASGVFTGQSKVSHEFFSKLNESVGNLRFGDEELTIRLHNNWCKVDCINQKNKRVIEFYGDYWHSNPEIYDETHSVKNLTASEIHKKDEERVKQLESRGYKVMVIWESDYMKNPEMIYNQCLEFING